MKPRTPLLLLLVLLYCFPGCNQSPVQTEPAGERIVVGPGPEDMVLDTLSNPRLLISCSARRDSQEPYGEIEALELPSMERKVLTRFNEPDSLVFRPHGIFLDRDVLYVISHEREPDYHPVFLYRVHGDSLEFLDLVHTPLQHSPNALATGKAGEIYLVNDSGKRGSLMEKILKLKRASLVRLKKGPDGRWDSEIMAFELGYPAGINRIGNTLFAGDATMNEIHRYNITEKGLAPLPPIEGLKGNDNIRIYRGKLLTACHIKPVRFIQHAKNPEKKSPVQVFLADPDTGELQSLFRTDGSQISAGSTAIVYRGYLYICQVFEPFILKVPIDLEAI